MEPMVRALKPLANFSEWLWDFHINGEGRDLTFSIHKEPWTDRNITNAQYAQDLTDNFTRWQRFFVMILQKVGVRISERTVFQVPPSRFPHNGACLA